MREVKAGKIEFRVDKGGNIHAPIGKVSFGVDALETNFSALWTRSSASKPAAVEGRLHPQRRDLEHDGARGHDRHDALPR